MRKRLIVIGGIVVILVLVIVIAFLNLEGIVNNNKDFLISKAEEAIGRQVTIDKIGLSLRGGIGVRLDEFSIADDPEFSSDPFLEAKSLQVNAKILPLFKREFEIKSVILREPLIRVVRNVEGVLNTASFGTAEGTSSGDDTGGAAPLAVSLVNIDDGELHFTDLAEGVDLRLTRIVSKVTELDLEKPVSIAMSAAFLSDERNIEIGGTFGPAGRDMNIETMPFDANVAVEAMDIASLTAAAPAIARAIPPDIALDGRFGLEAQAKGSIPSLDVNARIDATAASVSAPGMVNKPAGIPLTIDATANVSQQTVTVENVSIAFHELAATGKGTITLGTPPAMALSFETEGTPLGVWNDIIPTTAPYQLTGNADLSARVTGAIAAGARPDVDGKIALSDVGAVLPQLAKPLSGLRSDITFSASGAKLENTSFVIGGSRVDGTAQVESFEPLTVSYRATSPTLALQDVRPPNPAAKKPEVLGNIEVIGRMRVEETATNSGEFTSGTGTLADIDYKNLSGRFEIVGQKTRISDVVVDALDGRITGGGVISIENGVPEFDFKSVAEGVNAVALFDRLPDVSRQFLNGNANLNLNINGSGGEWKDIQKNITGDGLAEIADGSIVDFNIFDLVVKELAGFAGDSDVISQNLKDKYPRIFKDRNTRFENLKSDFVISDGRLLARNLALKTGEYDITGKGSIGFDKSLSLGVNLLLSRELSVDLIKDLKELGVLANDRGQIEVPFVLEGTLPKAVVKFDQDFVNSVLQKTLLQKGLDFFKKDR